MNFNKFTKAELISKINQLKNKKQDTEVKNVQENKKQASPTIWDIIWRIKIYLLSLAIITILMKVFKNYKTIRVFFKNGKLYYFNYVWCINVWSIWYWIFSEIFRRT